MTMTKKLQMKFGVGNFDDSKGIAPIDYSTLPLAAWNVKGKRYIREIYGKMDSKTQKRYEDYFSENLSSASGGFKSSDLIVKKITKKKGFWQVKMKTPKGSKRTAVPKWATIIAKTIEDGARVTMVQNAEGYSADYIHIPAKGVSKKQAKETAQKIAGKVAKAKSASGGAHGFEEYYTKKDLLILLGRHYHETSKARKGLPENWKADPEKFADMLEEYGNKELAKRWYESDNRLEEINGKSNP